MLGQLCTIDLKFNQVVEFMKNYYDPENIHKTSPPPLPIEGIGNSGGEEVKGQKNFWTGKRVVSRPVSTFI